MIDLAKSNFVKVTMNHMLLFGERDTIIKHQYNKILYLRTSILYGIYNFQTCLEKIWQMEQLFAVFVEILILLVVPGILL